MDRYTVNKIKIRGAPRKKLFGVYDKQIEKYICITNYIDNARTICECLKSDANKEHYLDGLIW